MVWMVGSGYKVGYSVATDSTTGEPIWATFGTGTRVSSLSAKNNVERVYKLGQRNPAVLVPLKWEGSWSIETYPTGVNALKDWGLDDRKVPVKGTIAITDNAGNIVRELIDAVVQRATLDARQGEIVRLTMNGVYKNDDYPTATASFDETGTPLVFSDGNITIEDLTNAIVQSFEISINMNADPQYGLGSRFFKDVILKAFEVEGRATVITDLDGYKAFLQNKTLQNDSDTLTNFDMTLTLGSNTLTLSSGLVDEVSHSIEPNEVVILDIVFYATNLTIT